MAITYDQPESAALDAVADLLQANATMQAILGTVGDAVATRAKIHEVDAGQEASLPFALLTSPQIERDGTAGFYQQLRGSLELYVRYAPSVDATTAAEEHREALNHQGALANALVDASYSASMLPNLTISPVAGSPFRADANGRWRGSFLLRFRLQWYSPRILA